MNRRTTRRRPFLLAVFVVAVSLALLGGAGSAAAAPALKVSTVAPDHVSPANPFFMVTAIQNVGDQPLSGDVTIRTAFPPGIVPVGWRNSSFNMPDPQCQTLAQGTECTIDATGIEPGVQMRVQLNTTVDPGAGGSLPPGEVEVSGGGAAGTFTEPLSIVAGPAGPFAIRALDISVAANSPNQAGSDPLELTTRFTVLSEAKSLFNEPADPNTLVIAPPEHLRDVVVHVPRGLVGRPTATPVRCTAAQLTTQAVRGTLKVGIPACPPESQVGLARLALGDIVPVYNLVPPPGSPAAFGFFYNSIVVTLLAQVRPSDHGIDIVTRRAVSSVPLPRIEVAFWGSPSDPSHDPLRHLCLHGSNGHNPSVGDCALKTRSDSAFLRTPTSCPKDPQGEGIPLQWAIEMDTYQHPGTFVSKGATSPAMEGCEKVPFDPSLTLAPGSRAAGLPSGLDVELTIPQDVGPAGIAQADLRAATVALPEGVSVNSASADGLGACTDQQLALDSADPSSCPDSAKIGSLELTTPLLTEPISGAVFLRSQASQDPESGDLFRLALEIRDDDRGVAIKLPGSLVVDAETGQLTTRFDDLPQLPFETMRLRLKAGPRAPLALPKKCGTYTAHAELEGWNGKTASFDPELTIDQNCSQSGFAPGFQAGVTDSTAGEFAPFELRVTRDPGQPNVSRIDATLPQGLVAKLAGLAVCGGAQAQSGECPAASRIGSVLAGIGEGTNPLFLPQPGKAPTAVYFAGPYKGAPYSIIARVPAQAGPFDLGQVLVRSAVRIDPETVQVTVASDPLPQIFMGVPVSYRDVRVKIDRPNYTLNPTDCEPTAVTGAISSIEGQTARVSDRFQPTDCAALAFKPKLSLRLRGNSARGGHPGLTATLRMPPKGANANIARASVALPHSEFLAQSHIGTVCTRVQFNAGAGNGVQCPKRSIYGRATAWTPLLDYPLSGPVYLRSSNNPLPDLVVALRGQIDANLVGRIDSVDGGIRTTFAAVPDAPVSKFVLKMPGGQKSLLENSTNICRGRHRAIAKFDAQNGRIHDIAPVLRASCPS